MPCHTNCLSLPLVITCNVPILTVGTSKRLKRRINSRSSSTTPPKFSKNRSHSAAGSRPRNYRLEGYLRHPAHAWLYIVGQIVMCCYRTPLFAGTIVGNVHCVNLESRCTTTEQRASHLSSNGLLEFQPELLTLSTLKATHEPL